MSGVRVCVRVYMSCFSMHPIKTINLRVQVGAVPLQVPLASQVLVISPVRV